MVLLPAEDGTPATIAPVWVFAEDKDAAALLAEAPKGSLTVNQAMLVEALTLEKKLQQCATEHEATLGLRVIKQDSGKARRAKVQQWRAANAAQKAANERRQEEIEEGKDDLSIITNFSGLNRLEKMIAPQLPQLPDHTRRKFLKLIGATAVTMSALWRQAVAMGDGDGASSSGGWMGSGGWVSSSAAELGGIGAGADRWDAGWATVGIMQAQQTSAWCGYAVTVSIAMWYANDGIYYSHGVFLAQCDLAHEYLYPGTPADFCDCCDKTNALTQKWLGGCLKGVKPSEVSYLLALRGLNGISSTANNLPPWSAAQSYLDSSQPIFVAIAWTILRWDWLDYYFDIVEHAVALWGYAWTTQDLLMGNDEYVSSPSLDLHYECPTLGTIHCYPYLGNYIIGYYPDYGFNQPYYNDGVPTEGWSGAADILASYPTQAP